MDSWNYDVNSLTGLLNKGKECFIEGLVKDGVLTEEQGRKITTQYAMVIVKKNWLGSIIHKFFKDDNKPSIRIVRVIMSEIEEER